MAIPYSQGLVSNLANPANAYAGLSAQAVGAQLKPPPTIASALGNIEGLNERLSQISQRLNGIADTIGGPRPVSDGAGNVGKSSAGIVDRLNEGADSAHRRASEIEELVASIGRALG